MKIHVGEVLAYPAVSDGIFTRTPTIRVRFLRLSQSHHATFPIPGIPPTPATAAVVREVVLPAQRRSTLPTPEGEATVFAEVVSVGRDERVVALSGHDAHLTASSAVLAGA